ncbi:MAG TPA: sigma-70 family RNA polymerase sigma factor [Kofleriaceae bacterium]|nr:sigma-70 family RNA polymerase sigma factor [Kofleriaceae bacterium]
MSPRPGKRTRRGRDPHAAAAGTAAVDHLATYFRDLGEHGLLDPDEERRLAEELEATEIETWTRLLANPTTIEQVLALLEARLENSLTSFRLLRRTGVSVRRLRGKRGETRLRSVAGRAARQLRALDLDRELLASVLAELQRGPDPAARRPLHGSWLAQVRESFDDAARVRDEFVRANLRLVVTMARRYDRGVMPLSDLIQEGNLGLMHAVSRFDYRRGLRFSTYACWWIRHAIGRALADKARAVRIPVHMLEAQQQLEKVRQALVGELGRPPTPQELAKAARVPLAKLNQMHRYIMGQPMSLDRPVHDDDDRSFGDTMADPDSEEHSPADNLTTQTLTSQIKRLLHYLSPIEADVLTKRFGLGDDEERTFREIGDQYHLSRERIRQIQNSALDKLKRALEREHRGHVEM